MWLWETWTGRLPLKANPLRLQPPPKCIPSITLRRFRTTTSLSWGSRLRWTSRLTPTSDPFVCPPLSSQTWEIRSQSPDGVAQKKMVSHRFGRYFLLWLPPKYQTWSRTPGGPLSMTMLETTVKVINSTTCQSWFGSVNDNFLCAQETGKNICSVSTLTWGARISPHLIEFERLNRGMNERLLQYAYSIDSHWMQGKKKSQGIEPWPLYWP